METINFYDAIRKRKSVRTFVDEALSETVIQTINTHIESLKTRTAPFSHAVDFELVSNVTEDKDKQKIGTYGFIKNAPAFLVGIGQNTPNALVDLGYLFETLILALTEEDLGTVWLGGTFRRKQFIHLLQKYNEDAFIPAITPVGYPAQKRSLRERTIRKAADADNRKMFETLFFDAFEKTPLKRRNNPRIAKIFDFVRKAPSASNKQPWRLYWQGDMIHVAIEFDEKYNSRLHYPIQMLDAGIAMCHLEVGLTAMHYSFKRVTSKFSPNTSEKYIMSYKIKPGK